jgi:hypothetical protein
MKSRFCFGSQGHPLSRVRILDITNRELNSHAIITCSGASLLAPSYIQKCPGKQGPSWDAAHAATLSLSGLWPSFCPEHAHTARYLRCSNLRSRLPVQIPSQEAYSLAFVTYDKITTYLFIGGFGATWPSLRSHAMVDRYMSPAFEGGEPKVLE